MRASSRFRFADLPILYKMLSGFALCSLLTAALGAFAVDRLGAGRALMLDFSNSSLPAIQQLMSMQSALAGVRTAETQLVHAREPLERLGYQQRVYDMRNQYLGADAVFRTLVGSGAERSRYEAVAKDAQGYFAVGDRLIAAAGRGDEGLPALQEQAAKAEAALDSALKGMVDDRTIGLQRIIIDAALGFRDYVRWIVLGTLATALLSFALGWLLSRAVARPLGRAAAFAGAIADGALDTRIEVDARDETGRVLEAMQRMAGVLGAFSAAQLEMARRHQAGIVDYRIDATPFPGGFGRIVGDLNALVDGHIGVNRSVTELVSRYAVGDLSRDMPELPGQLAEVTATIATVKRNMVGVNSEIRRLVDAAAAGDFSARGDAGRFQFEFQAMVQGLNRLMESNDVATADLGRALSALAAGDLGLRMQGDYRGRLAEMQVSFNATAESLAGLIGGIALAGRSIDTAAREISLGNDDLARRTEQQAANLEETAASMEELTSTVRHNADNAREANQLALGASATAARGAEVVNAVVGTMQEIEGSSRRIADIIGVIDGIAFQTNILALNAAVEAARAGEQGRGFAVVASEVRTLAQRSAHAAQEIKALIGESVERTGQGAEQAARAGAAIAEVVDSVQRVTGIMSEITAASQEQAAGIEQVNQAVVQMDETTQQNAALVEEASAAARSLEEQAGTLMVSVGRFRLAAAPPMPRLRSVPHSLSPAQV